MRVCAWVFCCLLLRFGAVFPSSTLTIGDGGVSSSGPRGVEPGDVIISVNCESVAGKVRRATLLAAPLCHGTAVLLRGVASHVHLIVFPVPLTTSSPAHPVPSPLPHHNHHPTPSPTSSNDTCGTDGS